MLGEGVKESGRTLKTADEALTCLHKQAEIQHCLPVAWILILI